MTKSKAFIYLIIVLTLSLIGYSLLAPRQTPTPVVPPEVLAVEEPAPNPIQTPVPTPMVRSQVSPDGTQEVILNGNDILANGEVVTATISASATELFIPFNTWSPDNKYFFIENRVEEESEYLVFEKKGKLFPGNLPYLKVVESFKLSHPESTITSITGWAAPYLIVVNAESETEANMSFWFDISSQRFLRLSTYFN